MRKKKIDLENKWDSVWNVVENVEFSLEDDYKI